MQRLHPVSSHVLVGTSDFCTTTTTVVVADDGSCLVVDPAVGVDDLAALRADLDERGLTVAAGFSTHPHWDHVLWSAQLGDAPRYAPLEAVDTAAARRDRIVGQVAEFAPGHDPALLARLTALPTDTTTVPWDGPRVEVVQHRAHAPGHAAVVVVDDGVLVAGDMCSDIEMPLLDLDAADPLGDYRAAIELFTSLTVDQVVPGHGAVGDARELHRRLDADRRYLDAIEAGGGDDDPRLTEDWLRRDHAAQVAFARRR